jgi:hypothetical protein
MIRGELRRWELPKDPVGENVSIIGDRVLGSNEDHAGETSSDLSAVERESSEGGVGVLGGIGNGRFEAIIARRLAPSRL